MKITKPASPYFFEDKPLFGLDIGGYTLRVIQLDLIPKIPRLKGYGAIEFDPSAIVDGVIVKPKLIAKAAVNLFKKELVGDISTKRVAVSLPSKWALTHAMRLPKMSLSDVAEAVQTEIDQYIPTINGDNFYMDYTTLREDGDNIEVFVVAMPKPIVDSYLRLTRMLGLEAVLFDTTIGANAHLFAHREQTDIPSVLVDFGSKNTDLTVFN
ncbi:MAG: type IV pilus biogenesis protein PilM, partial [Candidatus Saccharimonadales bacterium]